MNRHHPYGGYESHRGGSQGGPGPDRSHRGGHRGRGYGRGRGGGYGGGGGYDASMNYNAYDQGTPDNMAAYGGFDNSQNSYYQNNYGSGPSQYPPSNSGNYNQGYNRHEDGAGFEEDSFGRVKRPGRKDRDDKVHDSIIEERIQRERPCRTLFIRNIKYETNSNDVRRQFEEHGDIKTFFDLISTRGMVFVTYYDLRAAERARERLQGSEISGRPIDVHYSLPRDDRGDDKNNQLQGCLQVTLKNSASGQPIDDNEVRRKFQQFGDVKSVQPVGDRIDSRYVEFYDTRACDEAYDRLRHQGLQDGVMDIVFAWDVNDGAQGSQRNNDHRDSWDDSGRRGRGSRGRGRGRGRGGGYDDDYDRRDYGRDHRGRGGSRYDDDFGGPRRNSGPSNSYNSNYNDRFDSNQGGYNSGPPGGYTVPTFSQPPPAAATPDDRLEQARKVQQLLAALKQPQGPTPPSSTVPPSGGMPGLPPPMQQPPPSGLTPNAYYPPPAAAMAQSPYPSVPPPPTAYGPNTSSSSTPQPPAAALAGPPPAAALSSLPPNILALLQSAQQQQPPPSIPPVSGPPPPGVPSYGMTPPMMSTPPPSNGPNGAANYQQLMSFLQSAKRS